MLCGRENLTGGIEIHINRTIPQEEPIDTIVPEDRAEISTENHVQIAVRSIFFLAPLLWPSYTRLIEDY